MTGWDGGPEAGEGPPVALEPWEPGGQAVVVQPGASVGDLEAILSRLPGDACFVEAFGDVEVMLVYRLPGVAVLPRGAGAARDEAAHGSAVPGPGFSRPDTGAVGTGTRRQEVAAWVGVGLDRAAAALDDVLRLVDGPDAPFDDARAALFQERAGAVLGEVRHLAARVVDTRQPHE